MIAASRRGAAGALPGVVKVPMTDLPNVRSVHFARRDLPEQLEAFATRWPDALAGADGRSFTVLGSIARLTVPLSAARPTPGESLADYALRAPERSAAQVVVLLRAGAAALGYWNGEDLIAHKALRKYVVRGHGRAQPTYAKTRGSSRYGARLRLQNWRRLLGETNERLVAWWREFGPPERVFHSAPVRVWPELLGAEPPPPFGFEAGSTERLPLHVHRPDHAELLRVRGWIEHGRVDLPA